MFHTARTVVATVIATAFIALAGGVILEPPAQAADAPTVRELRAEAVYYQQAGLGSRRDIVVGSMGSSLRVNLWDDFVHTWSSINKKMTMNSTVPSGLPSKGHVFVVLGSALSKSGWIKPKFKRRLALAVKAAKRYPHAKILVSGGAERNGRTEAEVGAAWLRDQGLPASRIMIEKKSASTVGNAQYSMAMLAKSKKYTSYSLVTDSSHMRRASVLFEAAEVKVQEDKKSRWSMKRLANLAHIDMASAGKGPLSKSSVSYTASNVASVLGILPQYQKLLADHPKKPTLTSISARTVRSVQAGKSVRSALRVTAYYNHGEYQRTVRSVKVKGFSSAKLGSDTASAKYSYAGVTKSNDFRYKVVKAKSSARLSLSSTELKRNSTKLVAKAKVSSTGAKATGKVAFYLDGRLFKTVKLSKSGEAKYSFGKLKAKGQRSVKVKYLGNSLVGSKTDSAKIQVR